MAQVIRVYDTEANALTGGSSGLISLGARVDNSGGAIHNSNDSIPFYAYNKYYYRIDANEPVIEFHIDWDDGENNSPSKANIQIVKLSTPSFYTVVEHIYTESKRFFPLIRVKSVEGFLSKWYTNDSSDNIFTELEPYTVSAGQNQFSEVSAEKATSNLIPHFIPARFPPVGVLKANSKSIYGGIGLKNSAIMQRLLEKANVNANNLRLANANAESKELQLATTGNGGGGSNVTIAPANIQNIPTVVTQTNVVENVSLEGTGLIDTGFHPLR